MLFSIAAPAVAVTAGDPSDGGEILLAPDLDFPDMDDLLIDAPATDEELSAMDSLPAEDPIVSPFEATGEYEIYPTPHSVTYGTSTVTLPATMQVTYDNGIDVYTKARAVEAFKEAGVTLSESASTTIKLQVRIDATFSTKTSAHTVTVDASGVTVVGVDTDAAFYGLTTMKRILQQVQNRQVKHLTVEDYADVPFRGFIEGYYGNPWTVEDRAALMEYGGELKMNIYFYAPKDDPKHSSKWRELYTPEELETKIRPLAEAGNKSKCYYGFALHPFWAEGINYGDETQYAADLEVLKAKFEQVIKVGVRQIAVLGDDRGLPNVANGNTEAQNTRASYVKLLTDLTEWVSSTEMQTNYPGLKTSIPFCPNDYMSNASSAQMQTLKELPDSVAIIQTGGTIWGSVSSSYLTTYRQNMGDRGVFMWVNWPCSDKSQGSLIMGAHDTVLQNNLTQDDIDTLQGIMLNPMQQSEPSKAAIFHNADYAWNVWNGEDSAQRIKDVWDDGFKYVDHDSAIETPESNALRELAKHMIHNNGVGATSWRFDWHESAELKDDLAAFRDKLSNDTLTAADISAMRTEFEILHDAAVLYKGKTTGNLRILGKRNADGSYPDCQEQMAPWLDYWVEFTQANLDLLDALSDMLSNSDGSKDSSIVQRYISAQSNLTAARSHSFLYVDHYETALAGGEYIAPFTDKLFAKVAETAKTIIDPTILIETIITNRTDTPTGGLAAMRDGDPTTEAVFKSPNSIAVGDYVGLKFNRAIPLSSVKFEVGTAGNANDTFNDSKLQYMDETGNWKDIPGATFTHSDLVLEATGLDLNVKGVRAIATSARTNTWLGIKEITLNGGTSNEPSEPELATGQLTGSVIRTAGSGSGNGTHGWTVYSGSEANLIDGDDSTSVEYNVRQGDTPANTSIVGDFIGLDFGHVVKNVGRVRVVVGKDGTSENKWVKYKLQYSSDNTTWTDVKSFTGANSGKDIVDEDLGGVEARYVRLVNTEQRNKWLIFSEFSAWADDSAAILYQSDAVKKIINPVGELADDKASLAADNVMLRPGEFVGISLPTLRRVTDIVADYTPAPGLVLKVSMNEAEWEVINFGAWASRSGGAQLFADDSPVIDYNAPARYVRLENEGEQTVSFQLNELSVKSDVIEDIHFVEEMTNMGFDSAYGNQDNRESGNLFDGDMSTVTTLAQGQTAGEYVTYDLGQMRSIKKLALAMKEDLQNYLRHGVLEVSPTGEADSWTTVLTVDNDGAYNSQVKDGAAADPSLKLGVPSQNCVSFVGELSEAVQARYLRIRVTKNAPADTNGNRNFISAAEILINTESLNDMEYVSTYNDPTVEADPIEPSADFTPDKLIDGDLTTGFKPNMTGRNSGSLTYRLSGAASIGQISLILSNTPGVKLAVRAAGEPAFRDPVTLAGGFDLLTVPEDIANVAEIKLTWGNVTPTFYELITISRDAVVEGGGESVSSSPTDNIINDYSGATERTFLFDENWRFYLGDDSGASAHIYDDSAWRLIDLPHDYSIEGEYTSAGEAESGYLIGGVGWYRKNFTVDPSWTGKTVSIDFGGVYMDCDVYLNGTKLGEHHYGYTPFSFVLPADLINYGGENTIAVRTDDAFPSSRWYSGAGIYRSVRLTVTDNVHVAKYGTKVTTTNAGAVTVTTTVQNDGNAAANVTVKQDIYKLNGTTFVKDGAVKATDTSAAQSVTAGGSSNFTQNLTVTSPDLWNSWDKGTPNLYVLVTTVQQGNTVVDTYETEFGFREIDWDVNTGFKLNGANVKLKGVCQHHDQGGLGSEAWYRALERQVDILMDMGVNSIRVTHNPAADELIEICNRKGILIIDELFDGWAHAKNGNSMDFSRWFNKTLGDDNALVGGSADMKWRQFVTETVTNRDKNAPCVIMYSLCNEVSEGGGMDSNYTTYTDDFIRWINAIDDSRFITRGGNDRTISATTGDKGDQALHYAINQAIHNAGGTVGFNYCGESRMAAAHANNWLMYGSETASHVNSRGVYNIKGSGSLNSDKLLTSYDKSCVGWGATASDAWWRTIRYDYNAGEYIWTGFDYIGEPTPHNKTDSGWRSGEDSPKNSYFGAVDTNGLPKDNFWLYRSMWNDKSHTLHILPTWDREDLMISNGKVEVVVYTDAPMVKLYLNDVEVGSATSTTHTTPAGHVYRTFNSGTGAFVSKNDNSHETLYATFNVTYAEGTLKAVACDASGNPLGAVWTGNCEGRSEVKTTNSTHKLVLEADRDIANDARDLSYVTISVVDSNNEIVNGATPDITVSVSGPGKLLALDNGVQPDHTSYLANHRKAGAGQLVAIIQSTKENAGTITVTAKADGVTAEADGVTAESVTINTSGQTWNAKDPVGYEMVKQLFVQPGAELSLPATADVTFRDGTTSGPKAVTWNEDYDDTQLTTVGDTLIINGVIDQGGLGIPVSLAVTVMEPATALLNYSAAVRVGETILLPTTRPAVMANGTVVNAQFAVAWDEIPENATRKPGTVTVNGTAEVFGKEMSVTATIRVANGSVIEGDNVIGVVSAQPNGFTIDSVDNADNRAVLDGLRDGNTTAAAYTGSGVINMAYDTAQNFIRIKLTYADTVPANSNVTVTLDSGAVTVRPTVSGRTATYELGGINSSVNVTVSFASAVSLAEVELIVGTPVFPIGSTADLDDVKINGTSASETQLAAKFIKTTSVNGVINPISEHNVAVTILPENKDSQIILVTESEDHTERAVYIVQLDADSNPTAEDDSMDYPYTKTTATAPSEHNHANSSADGPASEAVDGDLSTYWHSNWDSGNGPTDLSDKREQRYIQLTLDEVTKLAALRYKPRSGNGTVTQYEVRVSTANNVTAGSKDTFTKVSEGTWANNTDWKLALFNAPADAKYVRLYGVHTYGDSGNDKFMSAAEIRLVKAPDTSKIDLSEATITVEPNVFEWKNVGIRPGTGTEGATVTVTLRGEVLTLHEDYELGYENNIDPGTAYIYARAKADSTKYQGAAAATFTIVKTEARITSFRPVTIPVQPGIDPSGSLPATVMAFTDSADGQPMAVEVEWDLPADFDTWYNFPQQKTRTLYGTVDPDLPLATPDLKPTVTLKFAYSQSVDNISKVTTEGVIPTLPETVTVQFDDGTSGSRDVSRWYTTDLDDLTDLTQLTEAHKFALTADTFGTAGETVTVLGDIVGINRVKAVVSVRVAESEGTEWVPGDTNIALNTDSSSNIFPMALGFVSAGNNNPYQAIKGQTTGSTDAGNRWSDWERDTYHTDPKPWMGVAFETSTANITDRQENQVLTLVPHKVSKAKVMFVDEGAPNHAVTYPSSYKLQYYTGDVANLTFNTTLSAEGSLEGNGRVRSWTGSPLLDDTKWADVTLKNATAYPAVPSENGKMLEIEFEAVDTAIIRVLCTPQSNKWVGVQALEVYEAVEQPIPPTANNNFNVSKITLDGEEVDADEFQTETVTYGSGENVTTIENAHVLEVTLPANTSATADIPKLAVTADNNASISIVQAVRAPGLPQPGGAWAQAVITSEDGSKTEYYFVKFNREGASAGFFIELDANFPKDKLQLVDASGHPVTGATPNTEITIKVAKGYQAQVWVEITEGDRLGEPVTVTNNKFLMPAASVHVYGNAMAITYKIQYLLNGGSFTGDPRVTYNVETPTFSVNDPTRPGYTFLGWVGGGLTQPTKNLTITKGSIGDRTYTAVWEVNGSIGGGGGNNGGGSVSVPVGDVTVTTKNPDGSTTVTTTTSNGLVSAVTTTPDGTQSAVIQIPQNSGSSVNASMPALDVNAEKTPEVSVQNNTSRPLSVTIPVNGANTVVAVRTDPDGNETVIPYSVVDENGLRVKVEPGTQALRLVDNAKDFTDVPDSHWAAETVDFVSSRELFNGMGSTGTFAPAAPMDRAMMTTVLWRLAEKPDAVLVDLFDDVVSGSYYEQAVAWGVAAGVVKGTDNGFEPNTPVTRETLAVMLYRAAGSPAVVDEMPRRFTDGAQVAPWAQEAMIWCIQNDIIKGYPDNTLGAKNAATRAEVATMLQRFVIHQI